MKIIRQGKEFPTKLFCCSLCGCVFEAERKEALICFSQKQERRFLCDCPNCGEPVQSFDGDGWT